MAKIHVKLRDKRLIFQKGVDEAVEFAVEDGVWVGFFVFCSSVFYEFIRLEDVVADLLSPFCAFASA